MIEFASNGSTDMGYLAEPSGDAGPGVVVIQEWWGLVDHIKDVCDRFAAEGFVALAPDLYHGAKTVEPDEAAKTMMALRLDQAAKDMSGAVDEIAGRSRGNGVGVVGFCMGGGLALMLASQRPDKVRAVVPFYGVVPWQGAQPDYSALSGAVLGHYAGKDESANPDAARALERTLKQAGNRDVEIHTYPEAEHAFFNDTRPEVYDPEASALAWQQTIEFLRARLS
jgi:carboxymethylenebutenolidase